MAAALAGSALGFLRYNFKPARIYMGDTGSMFIGFMLAALSIGNTIGSYTKENFFGFLAPMLILGVPIFDTVFVMFLRFRRGQSVFRGSHDHFALRLKKAGWPVERIVVASYFVSALLSAWALVLINISSMRVVYTCLVLMAGAAVALAYMLGRIDMEERVA
jgi:UDP-GlcNAc:undecaprenyl-phosphate/decaprenyl-phosphate GlcNAc-1-phosphate transferase